MKEPLGVDYQIFNTADVNIDHKLSYHELKAYYMDYYNVVPENSTAEEDGCPDFLLRLFTRKPLSDSKINLARIKLLAISLFDQS